MAKLLQVARNRNQQFSIRTQQVIAECRNTWMINLRLSNTLWRRRRAGDLTFDHSHDWLTQLVMGYKAPKCTQN